MERVQYEEEKVSRDEEEVLLSTAVRGFGR
jgi:hypothetical protein